MGIKHVVPVVVAGLVLAGCGWAGVDGQTFTDQESIGQDITKVRFDNDSGRVKITVGDETNVRRRVTFHDADKPGKTYRVDGDTLVLESCDADNCHVEYEVTVPEGTTVDGQIDSGRIELVGVAAANVQAESGEITVRDVAGAVNAQAESGRIDLSGIGGAVVASAASGSVSIELASVENVTAKTSSGQIEVTVPSGDYNVVTSVDSGNVDVDQQIRGDSHADHTLSLSADSGDVTVKQG